MALRGLYLNAFYSVSKFFQVSSFLTRDGQGLIAYKACLDDSIPATMAKAALGMGQKFEVVRVVKDSLMAVLLLRLFRENVAWLCEGPGHLSQVPCASAGTLGGCGGYGGGDAECACHAVAGHAFSDLTSQRVKRPWFFHCL